MRPRCVLLAVIISGLAASAVVAADDPGLTLRYAQVLFTAGRYAEADPVARQVLAATSDPGILSGAVDVVVLCRLSQGDFDGAKQAAAGLKSQITDASTLAYLDKQIADIEGKKAAYDQRIADLEAVIKAHPDDEAGAAAAYQVATTNLFWGKRAEALAAFQRVVDQLSSSERAANAAEAMGRLYLAGQQYNEAVSAMAAVVAKHPEGELAAKAQYLIGRAYEAKGDLSSAEDAYYKVMGTFSDSAEAGRAVAALSDIYLARRQPDDALAHLSAVVTEHEGTDTALQAEYQMGLIQIGQGQLEEADALFSRLHASHPENAQVTGAWGYLSQVFFHQGADEFIRRQFDLAVAHLNRALTDGAWERDRSNCT